MGRIIMGGRGKGRGDTVEIRIRDFLAIRPVMVMAGGGVKHGVNFGFGIVDAAMRMITLGDLGRACPNIRIGTEVLVGHVIRLNIAGIPTPRGHGDHRPAADVTLGNGFNAPGVARAIAFESKILIMDEPTAALGVTEASKLLSLIRSLRNRGLAILLITQRIPDILAIADRVFVLKGGQRQDVLDVSKVTLDDIVTMIVKGKERSESSDPDLEYRSFG